MIIITSIETMIDRNHLNIKYSVNETNHSIFINCEGYNQTDLRLAMFVLNYVQKHVYRMTKLENLDYKFTTNRIV